MIEQAKQATLGKSVYMVQNAANPQQVGGVDRFVVVADGHPVIVRRSNGQHFYVTYKDKRKARSTAHNLTINGLNAEVFDKQKGKVLDG